MSNDYGLRVLNDERRAASVKEAAPEADEFPTVQDAETFLQALAAPWGSLRATRIHANRMQVSVDGKKFTIYSRQG